MRFSGLNELDRRLEKIKKRERFEKPQHYFPNQYKKYWKIVDHILASMIGCHWDEVYSKICEKVPVGYRKRLTKWIFFPDRNGKYKHNFDPETNIYKFASFYVDTNGILQKTKRNTKKNPRVFKRIKKKQVKLDPLFKFDYDLKVTDYRNYKSKGISIFKQPSTIGIQTGERLNALGETVPKITYFTINEFIKWADDHQKTYHIEITKYKENSLERYTDYIVKTDPNGRTQQQE